MSNIHRVKIRDIPWLRDLEQDFKGGEPNHSPEPTGDVRIDKQE